MRASSLMWIPLAICVGVSMFLLKYKVQGLEDELSAKQTQIARDEAAVRVLQAEWTYLNDPERLRQLSADFLGFGPPTIANIADLDSLPMRGAAVAAPEAAPGERKFFENIKPQYQTELRMPPEAAPPRSPSVVSVTLARLQRFLFPIAAGATSHMPVEP